MFSRSLLALGTVATLAMATASLPVGAQAAAGAPGDGTIYLPGGPGHAAHGPAVGHGPGLAGRPGPGFAARNDAWRVQGFKMRPRADFAARDDVWRRSRLANRSTFADRDWRYRYHPGWGLGVGLAAGALASPYYDGGYGYYPPTTDYYGEAYEPDAGVAVEPTVPAGDSLAYCQQRYRSYDPASGTYLGYDGRRHSCP